MVATTVTIREANGQHAGNGKAVTRTLGGRYRLSSFLASGDTGEVWKAQDLGTDRAVAVKLLHPHLAADARLVDRFLRSRSELTSLWHPSIARLLDIVVEDEELALITDLVPGTDLRSQLAEAGPLSPAAAAAVAGSAADALTVAHRVGVVHGDVKPSNVVVPPPGKGPARLTDFAVALLVRAGMRHAEPHGPQRYRAPEVTDGAVPTPPSDIYALGVVLADALVGDPAYLRQFWDMPDHEPLGRLGRLAAACVDHDSGRRPLAADVSRELRELTPILAAAGDQPRLAGHRLDGAGVDVVRPPAGDRATERDRPGRVVDRFGTGERRAITPRPAEGAHTPASQKLRRGGTAGRPAARSGPVWLARTRVRASVALVVVVAVAVGGMAAVRMFGTLPGEAQTTPSPGSPAGSAPGGAATAAGPAVPTLATRATVHNRDGGAEFVRYWYSALTYAQETGDTRDLVRATSPGCEACQAAITTIKQVYADDGKLKGGAYLVRRVSTNNIWTLDKPIYEATFDRGPRLRVDRSGNEKPDLSRTNFGICMMVLEWAADRWRVLDLSSGGCLA
jgi:Protein kinase domain/Family of unknown function (DUF6318)